MAAGEDDNKKKDGKGFAGLSSLVSDVGATTPPPAPKEDPDAAAPNAGRSAPQSAQPQQSQRQTYQEPAQSSPGGSSGGKWVLGIAAVIGVLWLIGQANKMIPTTSQAPAYSPPAQSTAPNYSPPAQPQAPSRPAESKPPVGQNLVFSRDQIRYCLAEDIRMDGAKSALNSYSDHDVDRFNAMVADYNSRCGSFRYHSGALESARRDIERYRSQLKLEGQGRFSRGAASIIQAEDSSLATYANSEGSTWKSIDEQSYKNSSSLNPTTLARAAVFVEDLQITWSKSNLIALQGAASSYATSVDFYGSKISRESVMEEKRRFAERWPERSYKFSANMAESHCQNSFTCTVVGTVEWQARSHERNVTSTGQSDATFELEVFGESFLITKESGRVTSRGAAQSSTAERSDQDEAASKLVVDMLRVRAGTTERLFDSGTVIASLANIGYVNLAPDSRVDYSDYRFLKKAAFFLGHEVVVIDEEYMKEWVGCCVSPGVSITVRINGDISSLHSFARSNECRVGLDGDMYYGPELPLAQKGTYATLSCKERDAR